jgi:hypothetical protein
VELVLVKLAGVVSGFLRLFSLWLFLIHYFDEAVTYFYGGNF